MKRYYTAYFALLVFCALLQEPRMVAEDGRYPASVDENSHLIDMAMSGGY